MYVYIYIYISILAGARDQAGCLSRVPRGATCPLGAATADNHNSNNNNNNNNNDNTNTINNIYTYTP